MYRKHHKTTNLKLIYFPVKGRAEPIRYILAQSGTDFEDFRMLRENWPQVKPNTPMGAVPILEEDGKLLCQSMTIARYVAKKFDLVPTNDWEAAEADMMVDGLSDLLPNFMSVYKGIMTGDAEKTKEAWATFKEEHLKPFLDLYEKILKNNNTGYFIGSQLTWADLVIAEFLARLQTMIPDDVSFFESFENLSQHVQMVHELPNIKKYVANRPVTAL